MYVGKPVDLDGMREEWAQLAVLSGRIFSTPEWASAWWEWYGGDRKPLVLPLLEAGGAVAAIVPLYTQTRWPLRVARFIGHGAGDELGPVCAAQLRSSVAGTLQSALKRGQLPADLLLLEGVPGVEGWDQLLDAKVVRRTGNPTVVYLTTDWDEYLKSLSSNLRSQIRSKERKLRREHPVALRVTSQEATLSRDMDTFFMLHGARWGSASSLLKRQSFYRRFASLALARGWLRLAFLEVRGVAVATSLDFRYGDTQFQYSQGRDPEWDRYSVGFVLRVMAMREALMAGVKEYRFLLGDEPYKWRFATEDRESLTLACPGTRLARLATATAAAMSRSPWGRKALARTLPRG